MSRFNRIDEWARQRLGKAAGERITAEEARSGLVLPNRKPPPPEMREDPHLSYPEPMDALVRVARADRFIEDTDLEEDEPHLDHCSEEELYELAALGDEVLKEIDERR